MATSVKILDQFTDTDGTELPSHAIAPTNTPATSWLTAQVDAAVASNLITIQTNKAKLAVAIESESSCDALVADVIVTTDIVPASGYEGLCARLSDSSHFWMARWNQPSSLIELYEHTAGWTLRASTALAGSGAYTMMWTLTGTSHTVTVNAVDLAYSSATYQTNTRFGIYTATNTAVTYDNFQVAVTLPVQFSDIYLYPGE